MTDNLPDPLYQAPAHRRRIRTILCAGALQLSCLLAVAADPPAGKTSAGKPPASHPAAERNPRVLFVTFDNCQSCVTELERLEHASDGFTPLRQAGWKIGTQPDSHIQIVRFEEVPSLVETLRGSRFPCVLCIDKGNVVRSFQDGCSTPLDAYTFGWLLKGKMERPASANAAAARATTVYTTGNYPLRGNHWSVEDYARPFKSRVIRHLRGENHSSLYPSAWPIETWAYEELRSLHDDLHEMGHPQPLLKQTVEALKPASR